MKGRDIAIFMDGTWCDETDSYVTNILKMHRLTATHVTSLYFRGLGNEFDNNGVFGTITRLVRGAFGTSAKAKMEQAYEGICSAWRPGDTLYLFGFSRGAAIARMLAAHIYEQGINGSKGYTIPIKFLGCFDTVASFGIPGNHINLFKDFRVAKNVHYARHAVAEDETRDMFPITQMNQRNGVRERWFRGDHMDIGGGHKDSGLSDITLKWMIEEAESLGLSFCQGWRSTVHENPCKVPEAHDGVFNTPRVPGHLIQDKFIRF